MRGTVDNLDVVGHLPVFDAYVLPRSCSVHEFKRTNTGLTASTGSSACPA
jgi:hypothetical protein